MTNNGHLRKELRNFKKWLFVNEIDSVLCEVPVGTEETIRITETVLPVTYELRPK
jgi:hypothetical protein